MVHGASILGLWWCTVTSGCGICWWAQGSEQGLTLVPGINRVIQLWGIGQHPLLWMGGTVLGHCNMGNPCETHLHVIYLKFILVILFTWKSSRCWILWLISDNVCVLWDQSQNSTSLNSNSDHSKCCWSISCPIILKQSVTALSKFQNDWTVQDKFLIRLLKWIWRDFRHPVGS